MGFETILGNERLRENLAASLKAGHISHFYLISGPEGSGKRTLASLLSAGILCRGADKPCRACRECRRVLAGSHPDVITLEEKEKKTVSVELVRRARADVYIRPNESAYKIYILPRAQDMSVAAQNALLKVLEEPPAYGVFLLLADNPNKMLPTIRSRCVELKLQALPEEILLPQLRREFPEAAEEDLRGAMARGGGFLGQSRAALTQGVSAQTAAFAQAYVRGDALSLAEVLTPMEKWKREALLLELAAWLEILEGALACGSGITVPSALSRRIAAGRGAFDQMQAVSCLKKAMEYTQGNVSPAAVCGWLGWALQK
ncbi:MAG TPA: DNA polymerase III subunit [Candidatus Faecousia intestinigallinarum]|nr:DNA polymerase III subunit [Candidatus Faecousia intestinigallinarum]